LREHLAWGEYWSGALQDARTNKKGRVETLPFKKNERLLVTLPSSAQGTSPVCRYCDFIAHLLVLTGRGDAIALLLGFGRETGNGTQYQHRGKDSSKQFAHVNSSFESL
jgi:hypothetical protein